MKTKQKNLLTALVLGVVLVILFVGGCKKEISSSGDVKKPDVIMGTEGAGGITKVLRQSPGLKIEAKSKSTKRVFPELKNVEKMTAMLREMQKKKKAETITTSTATFNATLYGSVYQCSTDFPNITGDKDFYLVNENTWVYTYVSSSSTSYADFNVNKPSMYGSYRVWTEGINGSGFSNAIYLGVRIQVSV